MSVMGLPGCPLDLLVGIDKGNAEAGRQAAPDRRLAAAGHAHQNDRPAAQRGAQTARGLVTGLVLFASLPESHHHIPGSPAFLSMARSVLAQH
jgi:hypothetical protein